MNIGKLALIAGIAFLLIAIGAGVFVWYTVQTLDRETHGVTATSTPAAATGTPEAPTVTEPITVKASDLSKTQQKALDAVGLGDASITITPEMVACAEDAIGADRVNDLMGGAAPTPLESVKLLPCLKK